MGIERQCATCGLMLSGPDAGRRVPRRTWATHGICEACRADWARRRAERLAARTMAAKGGAQ